MLRLFTCLIVLALPAAAQDEDLGRQTFEHACAGCHGADATGGGPITELLSVVPPDLTRLAERNGGEFDRLRVIYTIDGRSGLRAHGGPMPIFGELFRGDPAVEDAPDGTPVMVSGRVLALVDWLESIQQ